MVHWALYGLNVEVYNIIDDRKRARGENEPWPRKISFASVDPCLFWAQVASNAAKHALPEHSYHIQLAKMNFDEILDLKAVRSVFSFQIKTVSYGSQSNYSPVRAGPSYCWKLLESRAFQSNLLRESFADLWSLGREERVAIFLRTRGRCTERNAESHTTVGMRQILRHF